MSKPQLDVSAIKHQAVRLTEEAETVPVYYTFAGIMVGAIVFGLAGALPGLAIPLGVIGAVLLGGVGYLAGRSRAASLHLQAQAVLTHVAQIEFARTKTPEEAAAAPRTEDERETRSVRG